MKTKLLILSAFLTIGILCAYSSNSKTETPGDLPIKTIEKNFNEKKFTEKYPDYQVSFDKSKGFESVTITNHNPYNIFKLPNYQEVIEYGYVSMETKEIVYSIDIFIKDSGEYYHAEYDKDTKELLNEDGDWRPEGNLDQFVEERLAMVDEIIK